MDRAQAGRCLAPLLHFTRRCWGWAAIPEEPRRTRAPASQDLATTPLAPHPQYTPWTSPVLTAKGLGVFLGGGTWRPVMGLWGFSAVRPRGWVSPPAQVDDLGTYPTQWLRGQEWQEQLCKQDRKQEAETQALTGVAGAGLSSRVGSCMPSTPWSRLGPGCLGTPGETVTWRRQEGTVQGNPRLAYPLLRGPPGQSALWIPDAVLLWAGHGSNGPLLEGSPGSRHTDPA